MKKFCVVDIKIKTATNKRGTFTYFKSYNSNLESDYKVQVHDLNYNVRSSQFRFSIETLTSEGKFSLHNGEELNLYDVVLLGSII